MLLVVDVGNSQTMFGLYAKDKLLAHFRIQSSRNLTSDEIGSFLFGNLSLRGFTFEEIDQVVISSVVPPLTYPMRHCFLKFLNLDPLFVEPGTRTGIKIKYKNPQEVGADRIANAVAAYEEFREDCLIIDLGTATTFCAVSQKGEYFGGVIYPGMQVALGSLIEKTSKLPRVEISGVKHYLGRTTVEGIQSGILFGTVGAVEKIIEGLGKEVFNKPVLTIATGGLSGLIAEYCPKIQKVEPFLTLKGLKLIAQKNPEHPFNRSATSKEVL